MPHHMTMFFPPPLPSTYIKITQNFKNYLYFFDLAFEFCLYIKIFNNIV